MAENTLYHRLGGYDGIAAFLTELMPRIMNDDQIGRFWAYRGDDGIAREGQLMIDFICAATGGPMAYSGRDIELAHTGMEISKDDWKRFIKHIIDTLDAMKVSRQVMNDVLAFMQSYEGNIVEGD